MAGLAGAGEGEIGSGQETIMQTTDRAPAAARREWDPLVKLTHWGVAAGVLVNAVVTEEGSGPHQWVGYGVGAVLILRWTWGLVGTPPARFSAFPPSLGRAAAHVAAIRRGERTAHASHNPLGALMVYALWATLAVVIGTGVAMAGPPPPLDGGAVGSARTVAGEHGSAPAMPVARTGQEADEEGDAERDDADGGDADGGDAADKEGSGDEVIEEVHEAAATLLYVLAALHLLGVAFETRRSGAGVVRGMLPGGRRTP